MMHAIVVARADQEAGYSTNANICSALCRLMNPDMISPHYHNLVGHHIAERATERTAAP